MESEDNTKCEIGSVCIFGIRQAKIEEESRLREAREEARRMTEEAKRSAERRAAIKAEAEREKKAKEEAMKKAVEAETQRLLQEEEEDRRRKAGFSSTNLFHIPFNNNKQYKLFTTCLKISRGFFFERLKRKF